jgi:flagellar hook-associated protein 1 FlgK
MGTLFGSFEIGSRSLLAQQLGLEITGNNIANVNTPGYSRQNVEMETSPPIITAIGEIGTGVNVKTISSVRDRFIELQVSHATQDQSREQALSGVLDQVESAFSLNDGNLQESISQFYDSFNTLATNPESVPFRNSVIAQAKNLASAFHSSAQRLVDIRQNLNTQVSSVVDQVNSLATNISSLNNSILSAEVGGAAASSLRDQRGELINKLSELVDVNYYEAQDGTVSISVAGGQTLVTAGFVQPLQAVSSPPDGTIQVMSGLTNITNLVGSGKLAGLVEARDQLIPAYQTDLDNLATEITNSTNDQHRLGVDLYGNAGLDFFNPVTSGTSAAQTISLNPLVAADGRLIAASQTDPLPTSPTSTPNPGHSGASGDNSNALAMANLASQKLASGGSFTYAEAYAALQFRIGTDAQSAKQSLDTQSAMLTQVKNLRDSVSGVSLDEEAINLIRFQRAYQASSRFISVIDQLTADMIGILGGTA